MKKICRIILALTLTFALLISFAACSNGSDDNSIDNNGNIRVNANNNDGDEELISNQSTQEPVRFETRFKRQPEEGKTFTHYEDMTINDIEIYHVVENNDDVIFYYVNNSSFDIVDFFIRFEPSDEYKDDENVKTIIVGTSEKTKPSQESEYTFVYYQDELKISDLDKLTPLTIGMDYIVNDKIRTVYYYYGTRTHDYWGEEDDELEQIPSSESEEIKTTTNTSEELNATKPDTSNPYIALSIEDEETYLLLLRIIGEYYEFTGLSDDTFDEMEEAGLTETMQDIITYKSSNNALLPELEESFKSFFSNGNEITDYPTEKNALSGAFSITYDPSMRCWNITFLNETNPSSNYDWKQFLKDYEEWVDSYVILLNKYKNNPSDLSILTDYIEQIEKLDEWSEKAEQVEIDLENDYDALKEYLEMLTRIIKKLY